MSEDREFAHRICAMAAGVVALVAVASWSFAGAAQAAGALAGGAITIGNFLWLRWMAGLALRRGPAPSLGTLRRALWLGASGARFGVIALAFGVVTAQGWLGLAGLLVGLTALPLGVVVEGLRMARTL